MVSALMAAACFALTGCAGFAPFTSGSTAVTERPLVTLVARLVGPTAAEKDQWIDTTQTISKPIPDNLTAGVQDPGLTVDTNIASSCSQLFGVAVSIAIDHPRPADLVITLSTLSRPGDRILGVAVLWDGPQAARNEPSKAASLTLPGDYDAGSLLIGSSDCSRWRLDVDDRAAGQTGTLHNWTLKRRVALYPFAHDNAYYDRLLFGTGAQTPNVRSYFLEVSRQRFTFSNAGIFGTASVPRAQWYGVRSDEERVRNMTLALEDVGFDFAAYDRNRNGRIEDEELAIVIVKNDVAAGGANRGHPPGCTTLRRSSLRVCALAVFAGAQPDFDTLTHELSHSLGAVDLYGPWKDSPCFSNGLTLMSCASGNPDSKRTLYLDPWHRARFGWMTPYDAIYPYEMGDETWVDARGTRSRPAVIRNPRDLNEYYLFEYRGRRGYDADAADFGIVAWHVTESSPGSLLAGDHSYADGVNAVGPDSDFGASSAWTSAEGRFMLPWRDGSLLPFSFFVVEPQTSAASAILDFDPVPAGHRPPQIRIIQPVDKGTLDAGWVNFEVTADASVDDRDIRWFSTSDGPLGAGRKLSALVTVPGLRTVTATARDRFGAKGSASIAFTARKVPPTATIYSPAPNAVLLRNQPVTLWGKGTSPGVFGMTCDQLTWTTDRTMLPFPGWSLRGRADQVQCVETASFNLLGAVTIQLTVRDQFGTEATASVPVTFVDPPVDSPPIVTIISPAVSTRLMADQRHRLSGLVSDPAGGAVTYRWTVFDVRNGVEIDLGTAPSFDWRPELTLRGGPVEIRLYGKNSRGVTAIGRLSAFVEPPPR